LKHLATEGVKLAKGDTVGRELILRCIADHVGITGVSTSVTIATISSHKLCAFTLPTLAPPSKTSHGKKWRNKGREARLGK